MRAVSTFSNLLRQQSLLRKIPVCPQGLKSIHLAQRDGITPRCLVCSFVCPIVPVSTAKQNSRLTLFRSIPPLHVKKQTFTDSKYQFLIFFRFFKIFFGQNVLILKWKCFPLKPVEIGWKKVWTLLSVLYLFLFCAVKAFIKLTYILLNEALKLTWMCVHTKIFYRQ